MSIGLTAQQSRALTAIRAYHAQWGRVPKLDDLGAAIGVSNKGNVHRIVTCLVERGHLLSAGNGRYRLNHEPIPSDPLANGWRFIPVEDLGNPRDAAA